MENNITVEVTNATISCIVLPYCDTRKCDITNITSPTSCEGCHAGTIAVLFIALLALSIFIILGNIGIIIVISKNTIFHNPFNMFKCSLAVADLLVGLVVLPSALVEMVVVLMSPFDHSIDKVGGLSEYTGEVFTTNGKLVQPDSACARMHQENSSAHGLFFSIIGVLSIMASIFNLVLLSVDRFLAVFCPIKYSQGRAIDNRLAGFLILIVWVTCIILSAIVPAVMGPQYFGFGLTSAMIFTLELMDSDAVFFYTLFAIALPYLLLVSLNLGTGALLFKKWAAIKKRTASQPKASTRTPASPTRKSSKIARKRNEMKATLTLLVMVLVFTVSTAPSLIVLMLFNIKNSNGEHEEGGFTEGLAYLLLVILLVSNSAWNFIIYSWRNDNFRKALNRLYQNIRKKKKFSWKKIKSITERRDSDRKRRRKQFAKQENENTKSADDRKISVSIINGKLQQNVKNGVSPMPITHIPTYGRAWRTRSSDVTQINTPTTHPPLRVKCSAASTLSRTISESSYSNMASNTTQRTTSTLVSPEISPMIIEERESQLFFGGTEEHEEKKYEITEKGARGKVNSDNCVPDDRNEDKCTTGAPEKENSENCVPNDENKDIYTAEDPKEEKA